MDDFGVLGSLFFDESVKGSPEGLARILGFVHLYRASGIHLLAFFAAIEWFFRAAFKRLEVPPPISKMIIFLLCCLSLFWIWQLQEYRVTLIRPIATYLIRAGFRSKGLMARTFVPLFLTFVFEWIVSEPTTFTSGALHYYSSVAGGLFALEAARSAPLYALHFYLSIGSWLPIAALDLSRDHLVSYMTPIYSYLSLPIISFILYPVSLASLLFQKKIPDFILNCWNLFLNLLFKIPEIGLTFASVSNIAVWFALGFSFFLILFWPKIRSRFQLISIGVAVASVLILGRIGIPLFFSPHQIVQLDVKQGDGALIRKNDEIEMIDVGGKKAMNDEAWIRKLSRYQATQINAVLLSHLDEDHVGALHRLVNLVPIACVETAEAHWNEERGQKLREFLIHASADLITRSEGCMQLVQIHWFESKRKGAAGNELMGGVFHEINENAGYFALGDGDAEQEEAYAQFFANQIAVHPYRIWKVGHHGSKFSSPESFLKIMDAKEYWISVGLKNHYHHPNGLALLRLKEFSGTIYRTDESGDIARSFVE